MDKNKYPFNNKVLEEGRLADDSPFREFKQASTPHREQNASDRVLTDEEDNIKSNQCGNEQVAPLF